MNDFLPYAAPPRLRRGDCVRIVAPSGPVDRERFERGLDCLRTFGLEPRFDQEIFASDAYLAGADGRRLAEFNAALDDEDTAAIWTARGGYGATRLLPEVDLARLAARARWLIGFSDTTALHALWQNAGLQSLHAAGTAGLADWSAAARDALRVWLFEGIMPPLRGRSLGGERPVRGPVIGGNLTMLAALAGTPYLPRLDGAIVFLEDVGERPYRLDRCLTQLLQAGAFAGVAGFAIGQLTDCVDHPNRDYGRDALNAIYTVLAPLGVPVIADLPVGHERSSRPLPLGATAILDPTAGELTPLSYRR